MDQTRFPASSQILSIAPADRWQIHHRLTELGIPSYCDYNGRFAVDVHSPIALIQLRSVLQQLTVPRQALADWLEHCWHAT